MGLVAIAGGAAVVVNLRLLLLPVVVAALVLLAKYSWARAIAVIGGGLAVLQSSGTVGPGKLLYFSVTGVAVVFALFRLPVLWRAATPKMRVALVLSAIWLLFLSLEVALAVGLGLDPLAVLRDLTPYLMVGVAPLLGIDLGVDSSPTSIAVLASCAGLIAAVGTAVDYVARRGVSSLPVNFAALPSFVLAALGILSAVQLLLVGRHRVLATLVAVGGIVTLLLPGTRTNVIVFAGLLALLGSRRARLLVSVQDDAQWRCRCPCWHRTRGGCGTESHQSPKLLARSLECSDRCTVRRPGPRRERPIACWCVSNCIPLLAYEPGLRPWTWLRLPAEWNAVLLPRHPPVTPFEVRLDRCGAPYLAPDHSAPRGETNRRATSHRLADLEGVLCRRAP